MENDAQQPEQNQQTQAPPVPTKFCKHCGAKIHVDAVICTVCGRQVEELSGAAQQPQIVITNTNTNTNANTSTVTVVGGRPKNKVTALLLCAFLGYFGAHKFYEGKIGMGILYLCTGGLCTIGVIVDFIRLLFQPSTYYV